MQASQELAHLICVRLLQMCCQLGNNLPHPTSPQSCSALLLFYHLLPLQNILGFLVKDASSSLTWMNF